MELTPSSFRSEVCTVGYSLSSSRAAVDTVGSVMDQPSSATILLDGDPFYISPHEIRTRHDLHTLGLCPCVYCQCANVVWPDFVLRTLTNVLLHHHRLTQGGLHRCQHHVTGSLRGHLTSDRDQRRSTRSTSPGSHSLCARPFWPWFCGLASRQ
jgi:hypothetical protein